MNSIIRLLLHRVASGNVPLTPQVLEVLKEVCAGHAANPLSAPPARTDAVAELDSQPAPPESPVSFLSPTGRWFCRLQCALLLLIGCAITASAASAAATFEAANEAFARSQYAEAARGYETVIAQHGYSAPVLFNLGNARQRQGQFGPAILNYERAALLAPRDPDIAANLHLARQQAGIEMKPPTPVQRFVRAVTPNVWFGVAAAAGFGLVLAPLLKRILPKRVRGALNCGSLMAALALVVAVSALGLRRSELRRGVVLASEAVAGVSPVTMAHPVFKLHAGEVVTVRATHGDFALIRNPAGQAGWVPAGKIALVIPAPGKFPNN